MALFSLEYARVLIPVAMVLSPIMAHSQTLDLTSTPATATIFRLKIQDNSLVPLGTGSARLKLEKDDPNTVVVKQDGFREFRRSFPKNGDYKDKRFNLPLTKRIVQVSALPYDATLFVNGESRGQRQIEVDVDTGATVTVELRKPGYAPIRRVYRWEKGSLEYPPVTDKIELTDRRVAVTTAAGADIMVGENKLGVGDASVTVPRGSCTTISVRKPGYASVDRQYCNKEEMAETPTTDRVELSARVVTVSGPPNARIFINQKAVGVGTFAVRIPDGGCTRVMMTQEGFLPWNQEYCADANGVPLPLEQPVELMVDDAYSASVSSEQANKNIAIEVNAKLKEEQAWKLIASIVMTHFDVLENSDSQTGYLRTAWQKKTYPSGRVVRTRIIVKRQSDAPLRYTVKIVSEINKFVNVSSSEDENFEEWNRLLNTYKDVLSEMQGRLN